MPESTMYIIWAAAILLFGIAEGVTVQLVSIWFLIGAVAALIAAFCCSGDCFCRRNGCHADCNATDCQEKAEHKNSQNQCRPLYRSGGRCY
mgnify:CR=1 FL=1